MSNRPLIGLRIKNLPLLFLVESTYQANTHSQTLAPSVGNSRKAGVDEAIAHPSAFFIGIRGSSF
ncbi:hypothetical protein C1T17_09470 [Sphingobium sp. SCG-1]|uniref:hypothetical protein n=1 Tax=Sphingobium sp. SCG-1 TaxID=2072936 RepID=UPI000CD67830|nr:hypothetical protein [Sphingobium sp. SCG-1]AUW58296.1 hypothetical protein C1T17_09470 [Sphingobium sp. SCG-1]